MTWEKWSLYSRKHRRNWRGKNWDPERILSDTEYEHKRERNRNKQEEKLETNKKNNLNIRIGNIALDQIIKDIHPKGITISNELTHSTAKAITEKCGMKKRNRNRTSHKQPAWKRKIQYRKIYQKESM